jgi:uncharacterized protein (DUF952 family)
LQQWQIPQSEAQKMTIFHIAPRDAWEQALFSDSLYVFPSPLTDGKIPCTDYSEVQELSKEPYYEDMQYDMVLLYIDEDNVLGERTMDSSPNGKSYYFIGGGLNPNAVTQTESYEMGIYY